MSEPSAPNAGSTTADEPLPRSASLAPSPIDEDWPKQATDAIVRVVDSVRDKSTGKAVNAAHAAKYVVVVALLAGVLGVLALIFAMRITEAIIHNLAEYFGATSSYLLEPAWIVYLTYGLLFVFAGLLLWRKANRPAGP